MAEHPNVALIRRLYGAFVEGDYPPVVEAVFSEDVVWHLPGAHPLAGDHRGIEAVLSAMRGFETLSRGSLHIEVHDILAGDDHAVALLRARGRRGPKRYDSLEVDVYHIRRGRVTEFWSFAQNQRLTDEFWS